MNSAETKAQKTSTMAIVALICAFFCLPLGVIFGIIALSQIGKSNGQLGGRGLAIAAIVIPMAMVPVMGILAAIAIPNFIRFQLRSKEAEAKANLRAILASQKAFHDEHGFFVAVGRRPDTPPSTQRARWDQKGCAADCGKEHPERCAEFECFGFLGPELGVYYRYACATSPDGAGVLCAAFGDLDGDGKIAVHVLADGASVDALREPLPSEVIAACSKEPWQNGQIHECSRNAF